jgi:BolA protein
VTVQKSIENILSSELEPIHLRVENESHNHNVPANSETHFKITLVSPAFAGQRQVQRHQRVYQLLREQMAGPVHALALHTYAPNEWQESPEVPDSPNCMGGKGKEGG